MILLNDLFLFKLTQSLGDLKEISDDQLLCQPDMLLPGDHEGFGLWWLSYMATNEWTYRGATASKLLTATLLSYPSYLCEAYADTLRLHRSTHQTNQYALRQFQAESPSFNLSSQTQNCITLTSQLMLRTYQLSLYDTRCPALETAADKHLQYQLVVIVNSHRCEFTLTECK